MEALTDPAGRFFNPDPRVTVVPLSEGRSCYVIDDVLARPEAVVQWAASAAFEPPVGYPYPGLFCDLPAALTQRVADHFAQQVRGRMGARRTLEHSVRLSMVTVPPVDLEPRQWQCHRDRVSDRDDILFAASVLYLFREPALGGTSFYAPRLPSAQTDRLLIDSQMLEAREFSARYGLEPGYMAGGNAYFEQVAAIPAAWNRAIFYDGGLFHSADIDNPDLLCADPMRGRLTLNSFFTCRRNAR